jgi:hypothetical protein
MDSLKQPHEVPTCGVVVTKKIGDEDEVVCGEPAISLMSIVDPDEQSRVTAVVLTCERHEKDMQDGKVLIFKSEDGEHIAIQTTIEENSNVT